MFCSLAFWGSQSHICLIQSVLLMLVFLWEICEEIFFKRREICEVSTLLSHSDMAFYSSTVAAFKKNTMLFVWRLGMASGVFLFLMLLTASYPMTIVSLNRSWDYVIIGAGPAGLQMGYYLHQAKRDYVVLERSHRSGRQEGLQACFKWNIITGR